MPTLTLRFCRQIIHTTSADELQSVQHTVRVSSEIRIVVVGRCCWGPRWGGIINDSPEHGRTVLVDIYRLRRLVAYGSVLWCPRIVPSCPASRWHT
jgi:hypothetical protein